MPTKACVFGSCLIGALLVASAAGCAGSQPSRGAVPSRVVAPDTLPDETPPVLGESAIAPFRDAARRAGSDDPTVADAAVAALREAGPAGLQAILEELDAATDAVRKTRLRDATDRVARQRHGSVSRLYWFTDLERAKAEAVATGRPILSLRLLGQLDEELSCANSRFFRVALYANHRVRAYLSNHFVLHWSSERPAPRLTVDYGDGRKLVRTVTGNSLHYVLDAEGRPVDALPGLYGPRGFLRALTEAEATAKLVAGASSAVRPQLVRMLNAREVDALRGRWGDALAQAGVSPASLPSSPPPRKGKPSATLAMPIAPAKMAMEAPMVRVLLPGEVPEVPVDSFPWSTLGEALAGDAKLDADSLALMRAKSPLDWSIAGGAPAPASDAAFSELVARFERVMAEDMAKNEYVHRATIHRWLSSGDLSLSELNERVYRELFLTPKSDPWLGLAPGSGYTAIDADGLSAR